MKLRSITRIVSDESGATAIEYGLIAALVSVVAITALGTIGTNLKSTFESVGTSLAPASTGTGTGGGDGASGG
ncbi:MAG: Flp family type IVb pilin [Rhodospirillales bacterium]|nr:Flp family type IVb pilin [Rhodospirillales bacterium]